MIPTQTFRPTLDFASLPERMRDLPVDERGYPISTSDLMWVAGFLEGEGSFSLKTSLQVAAAQVQLWPLERLVKLFGGSIFTEKTPQDRGRHNCSQWYIHGHVAAGVMMTLFTLMSPRRQAQICTSLQKRMTQKIANKYRTHCPHGHEYRLIKHIAIQKNRRHRYCPTCSNESHKRWLQQKRTVTNAS